MKKEYPIINSYIDNVCKGIDSKKIKQEIADELYSHIMELYERNIALGTDNETAQKKAVECMGDSETIAKTFSQLYPISTIKFLKRRALFLIAPLISTCLFSNLAWDFIFFAYIFLIVGLMDFRKINKYLKTAFILTPICFIVQSACYLVRCYFILDRLLNIIILMSGHLSLIIIYFLIFLGLIQIKKQLDEPEIDIKLAYISLPLIVISNIIIILQQSILNIFISFDWISLIINILPAAVIYTTVKAFIDIDFIAPQKKRHLLLKGLSAFIIAFVLLFSVVCLDMFKQPEVTPYSVEYTESEAQKIKENLISLGLPQDIANELPENEILKYKKAVYMEYQEKEEYKPDEFTEILLEEQNEELTIREDPFYYAYAFYIPESDTLKIRVLFIVEAFDNFAELRRDEFFVETEHHSANSDLSNNDLFFQMLCEKNNETMLIQPFYEGTVIDTLSENRSDVYVYHFGFPDNSENFRIYSSQTIIPTNEDSTIGMSYGYNHSTSTIEANNPFIPYYLRKSYPTINIRFTNFTYIESEYEN